MPKISVVGMDVYDKNMGKLIEDIASINSMALYDAAGVAADALKNALQGLPTHEEGQYGTEAHQLYGATPSEKEQLIQNFGVSRFRRGDGSVETAIGFTGYVNTKSRRFNNKVPAGMLMQCIEYGTYFRRGTHTISKAIQQCKQAIAKAAQDRIDQEVQKLNI